MPQIPQKRPLRTQTNSNSTPEKDNTPSPRVSRPVSSSTVPVHSASVQRHRVANSSQGRRQVPRRPRQPETVSKKTPFMLKLLSWLGIVLLCFVIGYMGASWLLEFFNRQLLLKPEGIIENQEDLQNLQANEQERAQMSVSNAQSVSLNLHYVNGDNIADIRKNFPVRTQEDNMKAAFDEIILLSQIPGTEKMKLLHVFKDGDSVFLDVPEQFETMINSLGERTGLLLITGIVQTMQENFQPVSQIRFLVNSKPPKNTGTINLSTAWKIPESPQK